MGCFTHGCACGALADGALADVQRTQKMADWEAKKELLEPRGELHIIWECQWKLFITEHPEVMNTITKFPQIMKEFQTETDLINAIKERQFYGFVHCDIW